MTPTRSKYGSKKTTVDGIVFDSAVESRRWLDLQQMARDKLISKLKRQVAFTLVRSVKFKGAKRAKPAVKYWADFVYLRDGKRVVEDCKSPATAALPTFRLKRHLLLALLDIDLLITTSKDVSRAVRTTAKPKAKP